MNRSTFLGTGAVGTVIGRQITSILADDAGDIFFKPARKIPVAGSYNVIVCRRRER